MTPADIKRKLDRDNFQPLRLHLSDGSSYEITDPGTAFVIWMEVIIGMEPDEAGVPRKAIYLDPNHVTRIEMLSTAQPQTNPRGT